MRSRVRAVLLAGVAMCTLGAGVPAGLPGAEPFSPALRVRLERELARQGEAYVPRTRHLRSDGAPLYTNRLLLETSPYLQQHAHNPVNWYPWGDEAFATAERLGRPVLVSIGYSTCHWCHVMEEESFDDPEVATLLNEAFVAVKVDREVRPDVDAIYMSAIQAMGRSGGWPLNVWLTPERLPFFAGTYFPPEDRQGRAGFTTVLRSIRDRYRADPQGFEGFAARLSEAVRADLEGARADATVDASPAPLRAAVRAHAGRFDPVWGGVGSNRKFPATLPVRLLLRYHRRTGDPEALRMATLTLEKTAAGGIHDQLGGGFHRYSVDRRWLVPHFEKMLYDNALRAVEYLEGWQVTGRARFAEVTRSTLDYLEREMRSPGGGFYSATDADSADPHGEMEEGRYFTWTLAELDAALAPEEAAAARAWWGAHAGGDLEGRSVLRTWRKRDEVAVQLGITPAELDARLARARSALLAVRSERPPPLRDEKVLTAWNGLAISAFARAGFALNEPRYLATASAAADFALQRLRHQGRLLRVYQDGRATGAAFLEDYAFLVAGLLDLYEASGRLRWLREARALQAVLDDHYADTLGGGYFRTADDAEALLARQKPAVDGAIPSGNSVAALNLLRLAEFTGEAEHVARVDVLMSAFAALLASRPTSLSELLLALDYRLDQAKEIVIVTPATGGGAGALLAPLRSSFVPNRILAVVDEGSELDAQAELVPLLAGKTARGGRPTAYVCENRVCRFPTADPERFAAQIRKVIPLENDPETGSLDPSSK